MTNKFSFASASINRPSTDLSIVPCNLPDVAAGADDIRIPKVQRDVPALTAPADQLGTEIVEFSCWAPYPLYI